jgi:CYTH domain-containing protein
VFVVPETATVLLGGGVTFSELSLQQANGFQANLLKTMMQIESVYVELAALEPEKNVLIVYDRGTMDPSAFCEKSVWKDILSDLSVTDIDLRDKRYDQVIHLETAAKGAVKFYSLASNNTRTETVEEAIERDACAAKAWLGHPYYDFIDNSTDFEQKILRVIEAVCTRLKRKCGVVLAMERLRAESKKRKFLVSSIPPLESFPAYSDFEVCHDYLKSSDPSVQIRVRRRGKGDSNMFTYTTVKRLGGEVAESRKQISFREYEAFFAQRDLDRTTIYKRRYCFLWEGNYFQLDVYTDRNSERCKGLMFLETFTDKANDLVLPDFLDIAREVTGEKEYSMHNLAVCHTSGLNTHNTNSNGTPKEEEMSCGPAPKTNIRVVQ